jgi:hemoglobin
MNKDLHDRNDIQLLVNKFYEKVNMNDQIGFIFNDIAHMDWEKHLPVMYDFWESTILNSASYRGNLLEKHMSLNRQYPLNSMHFKQWLNLFISTVDEYFAGEKAELAKQRAISIANIIQIKILQEKKGKSGLL